VLHGVASVGDSLLPRIDVKSTALWLAHIYTDNFGAPGLVLNLRFDKDVDAETRKRYDEMAKIFLQVQNQLWDFQFFNTIYWDFLMSHYLEDLLVDSNAIK
jgi:hypothetical protein